MKNNGGRKNYKGKGSNPNSRKFQNSSARGGTKRGAREDRDDSVRSYRPDDRLSSLNDMSWYNRNPLLTQAAASIPYSYRPGMAVPVLDVLQNTEQPWAQNSLGRHYTRIPGVLCLNYYDGIGYSDSVTSPASLAAKEMYRRVRDKFSGSLPEDAPDILLYVMAMDSIFQQIGEMKRFYRILSAYSPMNYAIPENLLYACGGGISKTVIELFRKEKMKFFQYINELVGMTKKFTVPAVMDVLNRHYWMADNVYADAPSIMAQMYVFNCKGCFKFSTDTTGAGMLSMVAKPEGANLTPDSWYEFVKGMIEALANSEDAYTINGHLMRAYEGVGMFEVDYLSMDEQFEAAYVPEVLAQIENFAPTPKSILSTTLSIKQDVNTNAVIFKPTMNYDSTDLGLKESIILGPVNINIHKDVPTLEDTVIATRMHPTYVANAGTNTGVQVHCGTEIPVSMTLYADVTVGSSGHVDGLSNATVISDWIIPNSESTSTIATILSTLLKLSFFDWHPIIKVIFTYQTGGSSPKQNEQISVYGDIHNYTAIDADTMVNLHRVCVYSEFNAFALN